MSMPSRALAAGHDLGGHVQDRVGVELALIFGFRINLERLAVAIGIGFITGEAVDPF